MPYSDPVVAKQKAHEYYLRNKPLVVARSRAWETLNKDRKKVWRNAWFAERIKTDPVFKAKRLEWTKKWREKNPEAEKPSRKRYRDNKFLTDPVFKITYTCRGRIATALRGKQLRKAAKSFSLIGCSPSELKTHLESLWTEGMSWENYGSKGWHIDHIRPCASFNLMDPEQQKFCFHYTNLQPLWAMDNMLKRDKII